MGKRVTSKRKIRSKRIHSRNMRSKKIRSRRRVHSKRQIRKYSKKRYRKSHKYSRKKNRKMKTKKVGGAIIEFYGEDRESYTFDSTNDLIITFPEGHIYRLYDPGFKNYIADQVTQGKLKDGTTIEHFIAALAKKGLFPRATEEEKKTEAGAELAEAVKKAEEEASVKAKAEEEAKAICELCNEMYPDKACFSNDKGCSDETEEDCYKLNGSWCPQRTAAPAAPLTAESVDSEPIEPQGSMALGEKCETHNDCETGLACIAKDTAEIDNKICESDPELIRQFYHDLREWPQ